MGLPLRQAQGRLSGISECQGGEAGKEQRGLARRRGVGGRRTVACVHSFRPRCPVFCCFLPNVSSFLRNVSTLAGHVSNPWRRGGAEGESPRGSRSNRERAECGGAGESAAVVACVHSAGPMCSVFGRMCSVSWVMCSVFGDARLPSAVSGAGDEPAQVMTVQATPATLALHAVLAVPATLKGMALFGRRRRRGTGGAGSTGSGQVRHEFGPEVARPSLRKWHISGPHLSSGCVNHVSERVFMMCPVCTGEGKERRLLEGIDIAHPPLGLCKGLQRERDDGLVGGWSLIGEAHDPRFGGLMS